MVDELPYRLDVKVCGITRRQDAEQALVAGADFIGFVFYDGSARAVTPALVESICADLPRGVKAVGVFVNEEPGVLAEIAGRLNLYAVQLHGNESEAVCAGLKARVWRSLSVCSGRVRPSPEAWTAERFVVDAHAPGRYGGTGEKADWPEARRLAKRYPVMLAGGLTPGNVAEAVRRVRPMGVDVSSGVESGPGIKSAEKIATFLKEVREAERMGEGHNEYGLHERS